MTGNQAAAADLGPAADDSRAVVCRRRHRRCRLIVKTKCKQVQFLSNYIFCAPVKQPSIPFRTDIVQADKQGL